MVTLSKFVTVSALFCLSAQLMAAQTALLSMCAVPLLFLVHAAEDASRDRMKVAEAPQKPVRRGRDNILVGTAPHVSLHKISEFRETWIMDRWIDGLRADIAVLVFKWKLTRSDG